MEIDIVAAASRRFRIRSKCRISSIDVALAFRSSLLHLSPLLSRIRARRPCCSTFVASERREFFIRGLCRAVRFYRINSIFFFFFFYINVNSSRWRDVRKKGTLFIAIFQPCILSLTNSLSEIIRRVWASLARWKGTSFDLKRLV